MKKNKNIFEPVAKMVQSLHKQHQKKSGETDEQEKMAYDQYITERIQIINNLYQKQKSDERRVRESEIADLACKTIDSLPQEERVIINKFIVSIFEDFADWDTHLYKNGILDGGKIMKCIEKF